MRGLPAGLTATGVTFDVLRIPAVPGLLLHAFLAAELMNHQHLGPVAYSERSRVTYWLIPIGTSPDAWPANCMLLHRGSYVALPGDGHTSYSARWRPQPGTASLTGATWLAASLHAHATSEALQ